MNAAHATATTNTVPVPAIVATATGENPAGMKQLALAIGLPTATATPDYTSDAHRPLADVEKVLLWLGFAEGPLPSMKAGEAAVDAEMAEHLRCGCCGGRRPVGFRCWHNEQRYLAARVCRKCGHVDWL
jgi:hypothetical protein